MKKVNGCRPVGSAVLVEMLTTQEMLGTNLHLGHAKTNSPPQGIILAIGPAVEVKQYGFQIGDRVILQGSYVPVPAFEASDREKGLVEPHTIKAILTETEA